MVRRHFLQLQYDSLPAEGALADWVDGCWKITNSSAWVQRFTVLPDGFFKVLLQQQPTQPPRLLLSGIWTRPRVISIAAQGTVVGIRCKLAAAELLAEPLPLNAARPLPPSHWLAPILAAGELPEVLRQLAAHLAAAPPLAPARRRLFATLYRGAGQWPVRQVAAAAGWPMRQLSRYFQQRVGLSLKAYCDILRAYAAARQLQPAGGGLWPQGSYYDQSHGIRQLRKYTGHTPRQLYQRRLDHFIQLCPPATMDICSPP